MATRRRITAFCLIHVALWLGSAAAQRPLEDSLLQTTVKVQKVHADAVAPPVDCNLASQKRTREAMNLRVRHLENELRKQGVKLSNMQEGLEASGCGCGERYAASRRARPDGVSFSTRLGTLEQELETQTALAERLSVGFKSCLAVCAPGR